MLILYYQKFQISRTISCGSRWLVYKFFTSPKTGQLLHDTTSILHQKHLLEIEKREKLVPIQGVTTNPALLTVVKGRISIG